MLMDVHQRGDLRLPQSLPEFQRLFPNDAACAAYLEKTRWSGGFICPHCQVAGEPFRFANRPGILRCRKCRRDTGLTVGTVMARSHTPLSVWFWSAYLVSSQTPGMSAVQLQRQLGLSRYETAFQILHKLRAGMVRPDQDRIGGRPGEHVEVDETWVGGRTRGKGRGVHDKVLVVSAVEVRQRKPGTKLDKRKGGRYAGRVRLAIVPDRSAESLCGFVESAVVPSLATAFASARSPAASPCGNDLHRRRERRRGEHEGGCLAPFSRTVRTAALLPNGAVESGCQIEQLLRRRPTPRPAQSLKPTDSPFWQAPSPSHLSE